MAISAEIQCIRSRVASPMLPWPNQTETESSITLPAAKPATVRARSNCFSARGVAAARQAGSYGIRRKPRRGELPHQGRGFDGGALPDQAQAPRRHVDAPLDHGGLARQDRFDQPDAGRALQPVDHEVEDGRSGLGIGGDIGGIVDRAVLVGLERTRGGVEGAAGVEGIEPQPLDDGMGGGAAGTAILSLGAGAERAAAMDANGPRVGRRGGAEPPLQGEACVQRAHDPGTKTLWPPCHAVSPRWATR